MPRTRKHFWEPKLAKNKERDARVKQEIEELGWKAMIVWECQIADMAALKKDIKEFLEKE